MTINPTWRLVHTKPQQEMEAKVQLERQSYTVYLPMLYQLKRKRGKQIECRTPLFPRYLFVRLIAGVDDWGPIRSTRGVSNLVRFGANAAHVSDELIEEIQSRAGDEGYHYEEYPMFKQGEQIMVTDGPFNGYEGIFHAVRGEDRVLILLDIIGKETRTEVSIDAIGKAGL